MELLPLPSRPVESDLDRAPASYDAREVSLPKGGAVNHEGRERGERQSEREEAGARREDGRPEEERERRGDQDRDDELDLSSAGWAGGGTTEGSEAAPG